MGGASGMRDATYLLAMTVYVGGLGYLWATGELERTFRRLVNLLRGTGRTLVYGVEKPREITLEDIAQIGPYNMPEHQIVAWTPAEREALGHAATDRFIDEIRRELSNIESRNRQERMAIEWERTRALPVGDDEVEVYAWGNPEPVRRVGGGRPNPQRHHRPTPYDDTKAILERQKRKFEESPTVTGGRVFG